MRLPSLPRFWRVVHLVIILNFLIEILYATYMVFFVLTAGSVGPLFGGASDMPFEQMMVRRQYALESWVAIAGLSIYLAITEVLPRRLGRNFMDSKS